MAAYKKAIECGCTEVAPLMDCFWGERMGKVEDPFGFQWGISTRTEVLTAEEVQKRGAEWRANGKQWTVLMSRSIAGWFRSA